MFPLPFIVRSIKLTCVVNIVIDHRIYCWLYRRDRFLLSVLFASVLMMLARSNEKHYDVVRVVRPISIARQDRDDFYWPIVERIYPIHIRYPTGDSWVEDQSN